MEVEFDRLIVGLPFDTNGVTLGWPVIYSEQYDHNATKKVNIRGREENKNFNLAKL